MYTYDLHANVHKHCFWTLWNFVVLKWVNIRALPRCQRPWDENISVILQTNLHRFYISTSFKPTNCIYYFTSERELCFLPRWTNVSLWTFYIHHLVFMSVCLWCTYVLWLYASTCLRQRPRNYVHVYVCASVCLHVYLQRNFSQVTSTMELSIVLCFYSFCACMLLLPNAHISESYNELPEHYVIGIHPSHINVTQGLLYTRFCETGLAKHDKARGNCESQSSVLSHFMFIMLLSCGDVHPCPGPKTPNYKYPCGVCKKPVKCNQKGILCDLCNLWHHTKCINMPNETYFRLANDTEEPWECPDCSFPYKFSNSYFDTTVSDIQNESTSSEETIPDRNIFQDFFDLRKKTPKKIHHYSHQHQ